MGVCVCVGGGGGGVRGEILQPIVSALGMVVGSTPEEAWDHRFNVFPSHWARKCMCETGSILFSRVVVQINAHLLKLALFSKFADCVLFY